MSKILTLEAVLRTEPTAVAKVPEPAIVKTATPIDDFGRNLSPEPSPRIGRIYQPRIYDRYHSVIPPWSPEQIVYAFLQAERGDMRAQSDLMEHIEDRDGAIAGFMQTRRLAPCGLKWSIEAANDTPAAEQIAEFVRAEIMAIPRFRIAFRQMQDAIGKGISALWIDWQEGGRSGDSKYRIDGLHYINPKRFQFHWQREELLILPDQVVGGPTAGQQGQGAGTQPPPWKVLLHQTQIKTGHPAKAGVLRTVAFDFLARNYAMKDFMVYCDIFGMPVRLGKYPETASDEDKAELAAALQNLGTDAAAIISKLVEIEFLEARGQSTGIPYMELDKMCERRAQLAILGQDQTNTHNAAGGRTQVAEGGAKVRQDLLEADSIDNEEDLTWQLCYPVVGFAKRWGWNAAADLCPKFKLHYEPPADEESYVAVDVPLMTVIGLPQTHGQIAKRYNRELPDGVNPDEIIKPINVQQAEQALQAKQDLAKQGNVPPSFARQLTAFLTQRAISAPQRRIDDLADNAIAEDATVPLAAAVARIVDHATSLEDLQDRLRKAFDDMDASELERLIRRTSFVAKLYGRVTAKKG